MLVWAVVAAEAPRLFSWLFLYPARAPAACLWACLEALGSDEAVAACVTAREIFDPRVGRLPPGAPAPLHAAPSDRPFREGDLVTLSADLAAHSDAVRSLSLFRAAIVRHRR